MISYDFSYHLQIQLKARIFVPTGTPTIKCVANRKTIHLHYIPKRSSGASKVCSVDQIKNMFWSGYDSNTVGQRHIYVKIPKFSSTEKVKHTPIGQWKYPGAASK